jgi:hypothetical protein
LTLPAITADDAIPAHQLLVELRTRITSQRLHYRSGDEETAAGSVHQLFATTRKLMADHLKAEAFGTVALVLLNDVVRPYTARWHRWMVDGRFTGERSRRKFRVELQELQARLAGFDLLLSSLVAGPARQAEAQKKLEEIVESTPPPGRAAELGPGVRAGIGSEVAFAARSGDEDPSLANADPINQAEWQFIHRRRQALGLEAEAKAAPASQATGAPAAEPVLDGTGLCLSGGGIRSATFCLGIVQVLARQKVLPQFDYLSTVSGGGYLGAFLTAYLGTPKSGADPAASFSKKEIEEAIGDAFDPVDGHESPAIRHLRNNSRYLLNGGLWGRLRAVGLVLSGIATNLLLVLPVPLLAVLGMLGLRAAGYWGGAWPGSAAGTGPGLAFPVFGVCLAALAVLWFLLPAVQNLTRGSKPESFPAKLRTAWETIALLAALSVLFTAALLLLPRAFHFLGAVRNFLVSRATWLSDIKAEKAAALLGTVAPLVFGMLAARLKAGRAKRWATALFTVSGPLFCLLIFLFVGQRVLNGAWEWYQVAGVTLALTVWGWLFVDTNILSPHGFYRNRLCECYLAVRQVKDDAGLVRGLLRQKLHGSKPAEVACAAKVGTVRQLPLSKINGTGAAPYHLINTTVNLPASHEPNLRGRDSDFYLFSRDYCGGPVCGYVPTATIEKLDPHVDLGTAMAVSGAAASANTGVKTMRQLRFLLALLNVRLGYWLRNPRRGSRRFWSVPGPMHLFYEITGWIHENRNYLNLSDGGHIENLALYELLRRRCKLIVVIDGGMEPGMECADLMTAQRYAEIDLNVRMELDVADLALDKDRRSRAYAIFGKIHYGARPGEAEALGWLLYLKLAIIGEEPGYVVDYRRQNPDFPHQSTADQIYDEAQFEAYRRLGECAAESLFREELTGRQKVTTLRGWFQSLANNLLPDNDPAFPSTPLPSNSTAWP